MLIFKIHNNIDHLHINEVIHLKWDKNSKEKHYHYTMAKEKSYESDSRQWPVTNVPENST